MTARLGLLSVLAVVTLVQLPAWTGFFHGDDLVALVAFGDTDIRDALSRLAGIFTWGPGERPHVVPMLQFWLGSQLFGGFYQGHVALLLGAHLLTTFCLYRLAERLTPGDVRAAPLAALLFGIAPVTGALHYLATFHHMVLALAMIVTALSYERFTRQPTPAAAAQTLAAAVCAIAANEAGAVATLAPLFMELAAAAHGRRYVRKDGWGRPALALGCALIGLLRLRPLLTAGVLSGSVPLEARSPHLYTVTLTPGRVGLGMLEVLQTSWMLPALAMMPVVALCAAGLVVRRFRRVAMFGWAAALAMALPLSVMDRKPSDWFGYAPTAGLSLALAAGVLSVWDALTRRLPARNARALAGLLLALTAAGAALQVWHAGAHHRSVGSVVRTVSEGLTRAIPRGSPPVLLVVHGVPAFPKRPTRPFMLHLAVAYFLSDRTINTLIFVVPELRAAVQSGNARWVQAVDSWGLPPGLPLAFRYRDGTLFSCHDVECARLGSVLAR